MQNKKQIMSAGDETMEEPTKVAETKESNEHVETSEQTNETKPVEILQPNATLYVSNIDWSIKKNILRRALLALFGRHGKVRELPRDVILRFPSFFLLFFILVSILI